MGALQQMMSQVQWGALDVLLVDLPPGTGDVQMTLGQKFKVDGAVIVSTPQDIALIDARKGINMFKRVDVPILGLIETPSKMPGSISEAVLGEGHGNAPAGAGAAHAPEKR